MLYQNPQGELFKSTKVWMVFRLVDSDFWLLNLYHKVNNKSDTKVLFLIEYSCVLSKSKVIFDTWIFITNTKGTQRFPFWMNKNLICTAVTCFLKVATFIYKLYTDMTLFKQWFVIKIKQSKTTNLKTTHILKSSPYGFW